MRAYERDQVKVKIQVGATEEQLDFPVIYASALQGFAGTEPDVSGGDVDQVFGALKAGLE